MEGLIFSFSFVLVIYLLTHCHFQIFFKFMNPFQELTTARKLVYASLILFGVSMVALSFVWAIAPVQKADQRDYDTIDRQQDLWSLAEESQRQYGQQVEATCESLVERNQADLTQIAKKYYDRCVIARGVALVKEEVKQATFEAPEKKNVKSE